MIPFIVTGGLMIAVALSLDGKPTASGLQVPPDTFLAILLTLGGAAMGLMARVLSAFIVYSIADRPGLVPGFVGGILSANAS